MSFDLSTILTATTPSVEPLALGEPNTHLAVASSLGARIRAERPDATLLGAGPLGPVLALPWTQEVCEYLGALRAPCIPRMLVDYSWRMTRTDFSPLPHQYRMAGMMSMWRRGFVLGDPGCVDADTEYLSPEGWKRIADYTGGPVAQYHPQSKTHEFVQPLAYVVKPCEYMLHFTGPKADQMLSPEHRVLLHDQRVRSAAECAAAMFAYGIKPRTPTLGGPPVTLTRFKKVPAPGGMKYCFEVPSSFLVFRRNGKIFCSGNTGKTLATLWAADYLVQLGLVRKILVVTYKSIMRPAWSSDAGEHLPWIPHTVVYSSDGKARRKKALHPATLHITNYDTAETAHDQLLANGYDLVVIDESPAIKTHTTRRWRFLYPIVQQARYAWCLTGTPTAQAPTDAYGQVLMMYGEKWGVSAERFKEMTMMRVAQHVWVPVPNANDVVFAAMQPAIKVSKREVMPWLPEKTERMLDVDLSKAQAAAIQELKKAALATLESGVKITSVHAAALRTKIIQIASGTVLDDQGVAHTVDYTPRLEELVRIVKEARSLDTDTTQAPWNKVLVLASFRATVERLAEDLRRHKIKAVAVHSGVSLSQRNEWLGKDNFNRTRDVEVVVAVPEIMSHGLTLTAANVTVWFTPADKAEVIIQAENRMDRPGQKNPMQILRMAGCDVERGIFARHFDRMETHNDFLSMYSQMVAAL